MICKKNFHTTLHPDNTNVLRELCTEAKRMMSQLDTKKMLDATFAKTDTNQDGQFPQE